nr:ABC transporter ATP-binding protein [Algoriphagus sp.]
LQQYEGTFITVSHDRHFIKGVANKIWYIEDHEIKEYPGTYEEYEFWKSQQLEVKAAPTPEKSEKKPQSITPRSTPEIQQAKRDLKKLEEQLQKIEKEIESLELLRSETEAKMADPDVYSDEAKAQKVQESYQSIQNSLFESNAKWEQLVDQISTLQEIAS